MFSLRRTRTRSAFTLVELLVVIAIIGVLMGLLVPAAQKVRRSAARTLCTNNLHQIGLAMHTYYDNKKSFPSGGVYYYDGSSNVSLQGGMVCWAVLLLPYLEQADLYRKYDQSLKAYDPANAAVIGTPLKVMNCPLDLNAGKIETNFSGYPLVASSSYKGVCGTDRNANSYWDYPTYVSIGVSGMNSSRFWLNRGMLSTSGYPMQGTSTVIKPVTMKNVTDGLSSTLAVGEAVNLTINDTNMVYRPFWGMTNVWYNLGSANPVGMARGGYQYEDCLTATAQVVQYCRRSFGGGHGYGTLFTFGDGHAAWVQADIDGDLFCGLATIAGGELVPEIP